MHGQRLHCADVPRHNSAKDRASARRCARGMSLSTGFFSTSACIFATKALEPRKTPPLTRFPSFVFAA
jgi:hypothetical protein